MYFEEDKGKTKNKKNISHWEIEPKGWFEPLVPNRPTLTHKTSGIGTVYISPNPKQPFSRAEDREQFCYGDGDHFRGFSGAVFTVIDQITQTLHYSNALNAVVI